MFKNVLVTTDGSERAEKAADYAIDLAADSKGMLRVISVVDEDKPRNAGEVDPEFYEEIEDAPPGVDVDVEEMQVKRKGPEMSFAGRIVEKASAKGIDAAMLVKVGNPVEEIVNAAVELGSEVIVIGSHGRGRTGTALMGSVAMGVVHKGSIPVLVVPVHED